MPGVEILVSLIDKVTGPLSAISDKFEQTGRKISTAGRDMALAGAAVTASLGIGIKVAADYELQLAEVATMLGDQAGKYMPQFKRQLLAVSSAFGESTETLSRGLYDILSASIPADEAMGVLTASVKAAKAGLTDTGVAADAITTIINSYGLAARDAADVSDWLFSVIKLGKTTFGELAPVIGRVSGIAAQTGVRIEELGSLLAGMTRVIRTEEAVTAIRGVLTAFLKPTEQAKEAAKELGLELSANTIRTKGLVPVLQTLSEATDEQKAAIFGNVRALSGMSVVLQDVAKYQSDYEAIVDRSGATQEAFSKISATFKFILDRLTNTFKVLLIVLYDQLLPTFGSLLEKVINAIKISAMWVEQNQKLARTILLISAAVGGFLVASGTLLIVLGSVLKILAGIFAILAPLTTSVNLTIGLILVIVSTLVILGLTIKSIIQHFDDFKAGFTRLQNAVADFAQSTGKVFKALFYLMTGRLKEASALMSEAWDDMKSSASDAFGGVKDIASASFTGVKDDISSILGSIKDKIMPEFQEGTLFDFEDFMGRIKEKMEEKTNETTASALDIYRAFWQEFKSGWNEAYTTVGAFGSSFFSGLSDAMGKTLLGMAKGMKSFSSIWKGFLDSMLGVFFKSISEMILLWVSGESKMAASTLAFKAIVVLASAAMAVARQIVSVISHIPFPFNLIAVGGAIAATRALFKGLAEGGIVTGPTLAMIGEGGANEAVIPLDSQRAREMLGGFGGQPIVFNLNIQGEFLEADPGKWSNLVRENIIPQIQSWFDKRGEVFG